MKPASSPNDEDVIQILKKMESLKAEYPPDLLAARRAAFIEKIEQRGMVEVPEELTSKDQQLVEMFGKLKSVDDEYPLKLLTARRSAFRHQIAQVNQVSVWEAFRSAIQNRFARQPKTLWLSPRRELRASLILAGIALVAFAGLALYGNRPQVSELPPPQNEIAQPGPIVATVVPEVKITCEPGYEPPLCLAGVFDQSEDLTFQGNGSARPAVAKDTIPGYSDVHRAAFVNDGRYGPGASWVSKSADSWIKIDLGRATIINTVTFGRDRLGKLNDRDPGQFVIAVALSDNVYANGNSSNDDLEYLAVYDSEQAGFDGVISGSETVMAQFGTLPVRFVKITFENAGTAIDEVQVFLVQPPVVNNSLTKTSVDDVPFRTATFLPTSTSLPTDTLTPVPTDTPIPTDTPTPIPTDTPVPTDIPPPTPTDTPVPTDTPPPTPTDELLPTDVIE